MKVSRTEAIRCFPMAGHDKGHNAPARTAWVPSPKVGRIASLLNVEEMKMLGSPALEVRSGTISLDNRVVPLNIPAKNGGEQKPAPEAFDKARFGFAGPDNRAVSLNIPAEEGGQEYPSASFDIEFDAEQPDRVTISLLGLDEDNFIQTVQKSISFPARLLAELLSKRQATTEEAAEWQSLSLEDE